MMYKITQNRYRVLDRLSEIRSWTADPRHQCMLIEEAVSGRSSWTVAVLDQVSDDEFQVRLTDLNSEFLAEFGSSVELIVEE